MGTKQQKPGSWILLVAARRIVGLSITAPAGTVPSTIDTRDMTAQHYRQLAQIAREIMGVGDDAAAHEIATYSRKIWTAPHVRHGDVLRLAELCDAMADMLERIDRARNEYHTDISIVAGERGLRDGERCPGASAEFDTECSAAEAEFRSACEDR